MSAFDFDFGLFLGTTFSTYLSALIPYCRLILWFRSLRFVSYLIEMSRPKCMCNNNSTIIHRQYLRPHKINVLFQVLARVQFSKLFHRKTKNKGNVSIQNL